MSAGGTIRRAGALMALCGVLMGCAGREVGRQSADPRRASLPVARFWYGSEQRFGTPGLAQRWLNVLGEVTKPESVTALEYRLDDAPPRPLRLGPDRRRLRGAGEFNVEIDAGDLEPGRHLVTVVAVDDLDQRTAGRTTVSYERRPWPLPYAIDWDEVDRLDGAVQVVDGLWIRTGDGVRPHPEHVGYDRVLAIGDVDWTDYEVEVPVTVHAIDESIVGDSVSIGPGLGIMLRWRGHTDHPVRCPPPHCGWEPNGASAWMDFRLRDLRLNVPLPHRIARTRDVRPEAGRTYRFRARVETLGQETRYRLKVWDGGAEEPADWTLATKRTGEPERGSFLFVAHHVDATFGDVVVRPVSAGEPGERP